MPHDFTRMTSAQLLDLPRDKTVFFFPVGPIEDHGPHLPMGLDLHEASRLCQLTAEKLEREMPGWHAIIMPPAPLGVDSNTQGVALAVRPYVLRDWLVDSCRALIKAGFTSFVCYSGHLGPKQLTAIEEAGMVIHRRTRWIRMFSGRGRSATLPFLVSACSSTIAPHLVRESPLFLDAKEHGGRRDTSVALAIDPASVHTSYAALPARDWSDPSHWKRAILRLRSKVAGYWGKPAEANAAWGQSVLSGTVDEVFPKLKAVLEGANPTLLFRSWYSVIPPNRTFFKAWIIALAFCFLLLTWIFMNLQALMAS